MFTIVMDWITLIFWTINIFATLLVGYVEKGVTVMVPWKILLHYLKTWFVVDMLVVLPDWAFTITAMQGGDTSAGKSVKLLRILRLARTIRLLRLMKLKWILAKINDLIDSEYASIMANIVKMILSLIALNHFFACMWYLVSTLQIDEDDKDSDTWIVFYGFKDRHWGYQYLTSFHWSITQFTPSSMHVQPQNLPERLFAIITVVLGLVVFSYLVGSITGSLTQLRAMQEEGAKQFWNLRRFLRHNSVPMALASRILKYLEHAWLKQKEHVSPENIKLLGLLSEQLYDELYCSMSVPHLKVHPLFQHINDLSSVTMHRLARTAISRKLLARGDTLFIPGETGTHMYFVVSGKLRYIKPDPTDESRDREEWVDKGEDWIAEPVLWTPSWVHQGMLIATTECDLLLVSADKFAEVIRLSPPVHSLVSCYATSFMKWLSEQALKDSSSLSDICQGEDVSDTLRGFIVRDENVPSEKPRSNWTASARSFSLSLKNS